MKYLNTWEPIADELKRLDSQFRLRYTGSDVGMVYRSESLEEWLVEKDKEHSQVLTKAILQYLTAGVWQELTKEQCLLIHARIVNALHFLSVLASEKDGLLLAIPNDDIQPSIHLFWLLDTVWDSYRSQAIHTMSKEVLRP